MARRAGKKRELWSDHLTSRREAIRTSFPAKSLSPTTSNKREKIRKVSGVEFLKAGAAQHGGEQGTQRKGPRYRQREV